MRIEILRNFEKYIKSRISRISLRNKNFTIISNNCWGTFIYKKFGLPYRSPFINSMIFAPDYIELLENFSVEKLYNLSFIEHGQSKYIDEMKRLNIYQIDYPIGLIDGKYEVNFLHYKTKEEARQKWLNRCDRIDLNKIIFKFSDGDLFDYSLGKRFDDLEFKNKLMFTSKDYDFKSNICIERFKNDTRVRDEWRHFGRHLDISLYINNLD